MTVPLERQRNIADVKVRVREQLGLGSAAVSEQSDFATAAQGDKADTALQAVDLSSTVEVGKGLKPKNFFDMPTLDADDRLFIFHGEGKTSSTDGFSFRVDRRADYITPGTFGYLNATVLIKSEITGQTSAFETGLAIIQNNYANVGGTWDTTPQHHAAVFQANRYGTAPTWGLVIEAIDRQFAANPVAGILGIELDVQGAGTDANNNKVGIAMVNRREGGLSGWSGPANEMGYGIYLVKQPDDAANNRYKVGIGFGVAAAPTEFDVGLDFISANLTIAALRLKANQNIAWVTDASRKTFYDANSTRLRYQAPGGKVFDMLDGGAFSITGAYQIFGTQVVASRRTGWAADTGTANRTANVTYSGTAEAAYTQATVQSLMDKVRDLSQTIKALKDDLIAHGLIGA